MSSCSKLCTEVLGGGVFLLSGHGTLMPAFFMSRADFLPNDSSPVSVLRQEQVFTSLSGCITSSSGLTEPSLKLTPLESESSS
jgi:hypothetical protein